MARKVMPVQLNGQRSFPVVRAPVLAAQAYKSGAAVYLDANGKISECATDPATIKGFSTGPAFAGPGNEMADSSSVIAVTPPSGEPYDRGGIYTATEGTIFSGQMYSGTTLITPDQTMVSDNYGVTKLAGGEWTLDQLKTAAAYQRVTIERIDIDLKLVFFKVMSTYIQA